VLRIEKDGLWVEVLVESACAACHAKSVCLSSERRQQEVFAYCSEPELFAVGEEVRLAMRRKAGNSAVRIGYLYPCVILLASLLVSNRFIANELICVAIALGLTAIYYLLIWAFKKKLDSGFRIEALKMS
jgi:sigma-E factor negative regulatory protein RseC